MIKIDAVGIDCPRPVIMTKNEFDKIDSGTVQVLADNRVCVTNLEKYAGTNGFDFSYVELAEDRFEVTITKHGAQEAGGAEAGDQALVNNKFVVAIGSKYFGSGSEELGESLMKSFIYTIAETDELPSSLIFFNAGIFLSIEGSPVLEDLKRMEEMGVEILSCGACLNFYGKDQELAVGSVSNMYTIYETIKDAGRNMVIA